MSFILKNTPRFRFVDWGLKNYSDAINEMERFRDLRIEGKEKDSVFLVEHPSVITMGRRGRKEHLIVPEKRGIPVVPSDRGGDVTLHAQGQLVIYPVIRLKVTEQRLHDLLTAYEELIIRMAKDFGVKAFRVKGKTGAWTDYGKMASIGIHLKKWTSYHGIALNVSNDLSLFDHIIPCGLRNIKMTGLVRETGHNIEMKDVKQSLLKHFPEVWEDFRNRRTGIIPR